MRGVLVSLIIAAAAVMRAAEPVAERNLDLLTGNINYRIVLSSVKRDGLEYIQSMALQGSHNGRSYSKRGWGSMGFLRMKFNGKDLFANPVSIKAGSGNCRFDFDTAAGKVTLEFAVEEQGDRVLLTALAPAEGSLETTLTAWPGEFNKQNLSLNLRRAATSKRDMAFPSKSPLGADEPWILLYDGKNNPAGNPYQSSCAVLRNPNETKKAEINITNNYSVSVTLERAEGLAETHYIFWSFPGEDHFKALERMRNLKIEFVPPVK